MRSSLSPGYGTAVVLLEEPQGEGGYFERELREMPLPRHGPDPDRDSVYLSSPGGRKRANHERQEVRGHRDGRGKGHRLFRAIRDGPNFGDEGVRNRDQVFVHDQCELEYRLERGLVPAGKGAAGVRRLELSDRQRACAPAVAGERAAIEAAEPVVQDARECQKKPPRAGLERLGEAQDRSLRGLLQLDRPGQPPPVMLDCRGVDREVRCVQDYFPGRLVDPHLDRFRTDKGGCGEVGLDLNIVSAGNDCPRQPGKSHGILASSTCRDMVPRLPRGNRRPGRVKYRVPD